MIGQNIWVRTDEQMLNPCSAIEVFDLPSKPKRQLLKVPTRVVKKQKICTMPAHLDIILVEYIDQYDFWLKLATVLKKMYADNGFKLFLKHSKRDNTFISTEACRAKFEACKTSAPVTIGSLYRYMQKSDNDLFMQWRRKAGIQGLGPNTQFDPKFLHSKCETADGLLYLSRYLFAIKGSQMTYMFTDYNKYSQECGHITFKNMKALRENFSEFTYTISTKGIPITKYVINDWMSFSHRRIYTR